MSFSMSCVLRDGQRSLVEIVEKVLLREEGRTETLDRRPLIFLPMEPRWLLHFSLPLLFILSSSSIDSLVFIHVSNEKKPFGSWCIYNWYQFSKPIEWVVSTQERKSLHRLWIVGQVPRGHVTQCCCADGESDATTQ